MYLELWSNQSALLLSLHFTFVIISKKDTETAVD